MMPFLDIIVAVLLLVAIYYCVILHRKLDDVRKGKEEFLVLIHHFDAATARADAAIAELKQFTADSTHVLDKKMGDVRIVLDDLDYLSGKAVQITRSMSASQAQNARSDDGDALGIAQNFKSRLVLEEDITAAAEVKYQPSSDGTSRHMSQRTANTQKGNSKAKAIEALMNRINTGSKATSTRSAGRRGEDSRERARQEQEILDVLQAARKGELV